MDDQTTLQGWIHEKTAVLKQFLDLTTQYLGQIKGPDLSLDQKLDLMDEMGDRREATLVRLRSIDEQMLDFSKVSLGEIARNPQIQVGIQEHQRISQDIQLTEQSLILYIQTMGFELRSEILKSLKEKESLSKFKSQTQPTTGEELDQKV